METITENGVLAKTGFFWRQNNGVRALVCQPLEEEGFANGFSTRLGGVSPMPDEALNLAGFNEDLAEHILENRRRFLKLFGGHRTIAGCWQVHGADVRIIKEESDVRPQEKEQGDTVYGDALVSDAGNVLLAVKTADCVPILIADHSTGAFAAVHAGWRGTLGRVVEKTVITLIKEYGVSPEDLRVAIGPAAGPCCYEVGPEVIENFRQSFSNAADLFIATRDNHARIDLFKANRDQMVSVGLQLGRIHTAPFCTMCRPDLFFSYRREKQVHGKVGRSMAVIGHKC